MRLTRYSFALLSLTWICVPFANAQNSLDLNVGLGSARVGSNGSGIDNALSPNAFGTCTVSSGDPYCQATPGLSGVFLGLGGSMMLNKHFGAGMELNLQPAKSDYGPLQFRQMFYDFNGIYAPVNEKRVQLHLEGGVGGALHRSRDLRPVHRLRGLHYRLPP